MDEVDVDAIDEVSALHSARTSGSDLGAEYDGAEVLDTGDELQASCTSGEQDEEEQRLQAELAELEAEIADLKEGHHDTDSLGNGDGDLLEDEEPVYDDDEEDDDGGDATAAGAVDLDMSEVSLSEADAAEEEHFQLAQQLAALEEQKAALQAAGGRAESALAVAHELADHDRLTAELSALEHALGSTGPALLDAADAGRNTTENFHAAHAGNPAAGAFATAEHTEPDASSHDDPAAPAWVSFEDYDALHLAKLASDHQIEALEQQLATETHAKTALQATVTGLEQQLATETAVWAGRVAAASEVAAQTQAQLDALRRNHEQELNEIADLHALELSHTQEPAATEIARLHQQVRELQQLLVQHHQQGQQQQQNKTAGTPARGQPPSKPLLFDRVTPGQGSTRARAPSPSTARPVSSGGLKVTASTAPSAEPLLGSRPASRSGAVHTPGPAAGNAAELGERWVETRHNLKPSREELAAMRTYFEQASIAYIQSTFPSQTHVVHLFRETQRLLTDNVVCQAAAAGAHDLQRQLDQAHMLCSEEHVPVLEALHHERDALEARLTMLEAELATSATTASVSLREQTLALQSHNATLAAKEHALAEELAQLKLQVHALTTEAAQRTSERDSAVAQYDAMLHSNADREAELTTALEALKREAEAERASLLASAAAVRESVQQQAFVAAAAHQRTAELAKQQHEAQLAQLKAAHDASIAGKDALVAQMQSELAHLQALMAETSEQDQVGFQALLTASRTEMERVRDEHAAELNEFKHIVAQQQREVAAVAQTKQQQLQQEVSALSGQLTQAQLEAAAAFRQQQEKILALEQERQTLQTQLPVAESTVAQLQNELAQVRVEFDAELAAMHDSTAHTAAAHREELTRLSAAHRAQLLAEEQKHANAAAPLSKQITALSNDKAQLNADVQTCKDALAAAQATASQLQAALHQSQLAFDEKNTALQALLAREAGAQQFFAQEQLHNSFQQTATQAAVSRGSFVSAAFAPDTTAVDDDIAMEGLEFPMQGVHADEATWKSQRHVADQLQRAEETQVVDRETIVSLEEQIAAQRLDLSRQIRDLLQEKAGLLESLVAAQATNRELSNMVAAVCGEEKGVNPDTFKQQRAQQERDMANMAAEILRLKTQALNPAGVQSVPVSDYEKHVGSVGATVVQLKREAEEQTQAAEKLRKELAKARLQSEQGLRDFAVQKQQLALLAEELSAAHDHVMQSPIWRQQLSAQPPVAAQAPEDFVRVLVAAVRRAEASLDDAATENTIAQQQRGALERQLAEQTRKAVDLAGQLLASNSALSSAGTFGDALESLRDAVLRERTQSERHAGVLKAAITDAGHDTMRLQTLLNDKVAEVERITVLLQQSDAQNAATERALTQERGRRLDLERQLGDARAEIATKAGDLGALQTDLFGESTRRAAAEVRLQTLEKEIQQLTATLSQAREAERQLNGQLSQEQVSKSQLQIAAKETRDQLADARLTIEALRESISQEIAGRQLTADKLAAVETRCAQQAEALTVATAEHTAGVNLKRQLTEVRTALDETQEARERDRLRAHEDALALRAQLTREQRKAEAATTALDRKISSLQHRVDSDSKALATADAALVQTREECRRLQVQLAANNEAKESAQQNIAQLTATLRERERELSGLRATHTLTVGDLARAQQQNTLLASRRPVAVAGGLRSGLNTTAMSLARDGPGMGMSTPMQPPRIRPSDLLAQGTPSKVMASP